MFVLWPTNVNQFYRVLDYKKSQVFTFLRFTLPYCICIIALKLSANSLDLVLIIHSVDGFAVCYVVWFVVQILAPTFFYNYILPKLWICCSLSYGRILQVKISRILCDLTWGCYICIVATVSYLSDEHFLLIFSFKCLECFCCLSYFFHVSQNSLSFCWLLICCSIKLSCC
jgi:hypothetical protein